MNIATASKGMIHCLLLNGTGGARPLSWPEVATIFLPLSFFTGLVGINVSGMPGVEDDNAFWMVVVLCIGLIPTLAALFRRKEWI